jgi:PLP dependent protein
MNGPSIANQIADNLKTVQAKITAACARAKRDPGAVRLIAVSKQQSLEKLKAAVAAGHRCFGENYVQEALGKQSLVSTVEWHLIGALQSNKAKAAVGKFALIHTIDRESVLQEISKRAVEQNLVQPILIEVNIGLEGSKAGLPPIELPAFLTRARQLPGLSVRGLMCMPPPGAAEASRPHFVQMRRLMAENGAPGFVELSMGSSQDFEVAVEEGATFVRVGSDIFGARGE